MAGPSLRRDADPVLDAQAAAQLCSIVTCHALIGGNKRLGWVSLRRTRADPREADIRPFNGRSGRSEPPARHRRR